MARIGLSRDAYVLGVLIFVSMNTVTVVLGFLETECIQSALCKLLQGDIQRDSGNSFQKSYDEAINEMKKHLKFKECGMEKINEKCEGRGKICLTGLKMLASKNYPAKGLRRNIFHECEVGAWSYVLFLCKNQKNWPKFVTDNLPKEFMICNSTCLSMSEFDEYHKKKGKKDADFPPFWKEKMASMEESKKFIEEPVNTTNSAGGENRQFVKYDPDPREPTDVVERLYFGNEFTDGDSYRELFCDKNSWMIGLDEDLPTKIFYLCATWDGVKNPRGSLQYHKFPLQERHVYPALRPSELKNDKSDLSPTRLIVCKQNKFKKYQPDDSNPLLVGMQFRINGNRQFDSGRYLCAGDTIQTEFSKNVGSGDRPEFTSSQRCPVLTAICSVRGKYRGREIVQLTFGCCKVEPLHLLNSQIFDTLPYTWGGVERNTSRTYESAFTETHRNYPFTFSGEVNRKTWMCPPHYYIDSFYVDVIIPEISNMCTATGTGCGTIIPYLFQTKLYCNSVSGLSDRQELKGLANFWNTMKIQSNIDKPFNQTQRCGGFYTGGEFQCFGHSLFKKYKCGNAFQVIEKIFYNGILSETFGWWSHTAEVSRAKRFRSLPDFQVEFKCPASTALCGLGVLGGKNQVGNNRIDLSVEGLFYDHLCCPITLQLCTEAEFRVQLDPIPSHCNIPSGVNGTCILSYVTTIVQIYENNTNTMRSDSDKDTFMVSGMVGVGPATVINATVNVGLSYMSVSEKVKMYGFEKSFSSTETSTTNSTQVFFIDQGRTLLTYRPYIYCGGFKIGSQTIISIQTPSTNCEAFDEFVLFDEISNPGKTEKKVNVTYIGVGTRWVTGRTPDQIDIPWKDIITNLPIKFKGDPLFAISPKTKYRWQSADKEVFEEYSPIELSFEYTLKPGLSHLFSRVIGSCGVDWELQPRVTAQNVKVETSPI